MRAESEIEEVPVTSLGGIATALAKAQSCFTAVPKTKVAKVPMKAGGTYSYNYADLADIWDMIRRPLGEAGIAVVQPVETFENKVAVTTKLIHAGTGQSLSCKVTMPTFQAGAQGLGSAITYARRYGLGSMLGIVTDDDDDGALATHGGSRPSQQRPVHSQAAPAPESTPRAAQVRAAMKPPAVIDVKEGESEEQAKARTVAPRALAGLSDADLSSALDTTRSRLEGMKPGNKTHEGLLAHMKNLEAELSARISKAAPL